MITNPPPSSAPDGTGGIINLITKKAKGAGFTDFAARRSAGDGDRYRGGR